MVKTHLRLWDGMRNRSWLRSVVTTMQKGLVAQGALPDTPNSVDGLFGRGTARAVARFQQANRLTPTGRFDKREWKAIAHSLPTPNQDFTELLPKFRGDLEWIHYQEGFRGRPYWPGGRSGITLEPGLDIGHASSDLIETLYGPLLNRQQMTALRGFYGFTGNDARLALQSSPVLQSIRITEKQSTELMPHTATPYWRGITNRFRGLCLKSTPPSVQTVLLSLAYNRGILNRHLGVLEAPIEDKNWSQVGAIIATMQQNHRLAGIRKRRREEGLLVQAELDLLGR